jgi:hypothetical protein
MTPDFWHPTDYVSWLTAAPLLRLNRSLLRAGRLNLQLAASVPSY